MNWIAILVAALIPTVVGFIYYNPKVVGTAWMKAADMTEEKIQGANMGIIFGVSLILSIMLSLFLTSVVIHQVHLQSLLMNEPGFGDASSEIGQLLAEMDSKYGDNFRTFQHGALHGAIAGLFFVLPVLGTNALFERKGFKYIAINACYWIITIALMGGIICAWQ
jgi:hypothetical protein